MFFAEEEEKEFSEAVQEEISKLESEDREIYELNKKNKNIDLKVINFVVGALNIFLKHEKNLNKKQIDLMTEAIGNIPITFFSLDELNVKKNIKETINPLIDIVDAHANFHINRKKLILSVLKNLERLQKDILTNTVE